DPAPPRPARRRCVGAPPRPTGGPLQSGRQGVFRIGPLTDEPHVPCPVRGRQRRPRMETEWPRMTVESLKDCNKKALAQMAKDQGIVGWHAMRKDQLIRALSAAPPAPKRGAGKPPAASKAPAPAEGP